LLHSGFGAELINEELGVGVTFDVLEKQGWAAASLTQAKRWLGWGTLFWDGGLAFAYAVGDFGNFENGIDFGLYAFQFPASV
jgi:hypothetical protein